MTRAEWVANRVAAAKLPMPKKLNVLNDLQIRRLLAAGEPVAKSDGDGLTLTISKSGTASWILRYRAAGRRKEITLGNYPDMSLAGAREHARALRVQIDQGHDPAALKQARRLRVTAEWTVRDLVRDYRDKVLTAAVYSGETLSYRNADIDQVVLPRLGSWRVASVTSTDVVGLLRGLGRTWTMSKRLLTTLSQLMDHACGLQIIAANPCVGIKIMAIFGPRPPVRKRLMLTRDELRTLLGGIDEIGRANALAFRILLATCVRGYELVRAEKKNLDLDAGTWWVPAEAVKTRSGFLVPLTPIVVEWFRELVALSGESQWVLPARRDDRRRKLGDVPVGRTTLWAAFNRAFLRGDIDIRRFTPHDTRSTAKGHLRNLGVSREISEIALNHALRGTEGVYDVRLEIPERRRALMLWSEFLVACEQGNDPTPSNVVPLRRKA